MALSAALAPVVDKELGELPAWDLRDLYPAPDSPELNRDLEDCAAAAKAFQKDHQGRLSDLKGDKLASAIQTYEKLQEVLGRIMSYAQLIYQGDLSSAEAGGLYQNLQERTTEISAALLFFTLELNRISDGDLQKKLKDESLAHYEPWLRDIRTFRPHQLSDELERFQHEKNVTGRGAWNRLFDETMAGLRFPIGQETFTLAEVLNRLTDRDGAVRKSAAEALGKALKDNVSTFALVTNTLAKDKAIEDNWRNFARPVSSRNLGNFVEDEVVDALVNAVTDNYPSLSHRYYGLKAKWFGVEKLPYWDRNAPLPEDDDSIVTWDAARERVLSAYNAFSPDLAAVGKSFFDNAWIDAPVRPGKASGAFAHPTVPGAHPYLLLNYQGRVRDVMTLAHELGHGVHQVLAGPQGYLMADTPLTLAETASVFGEMLTFQSMLREETDPKRRKVMLAGKVEDMLNTVVRQIAMHCFETRLHDERKKGEILPDRIGEIWMETQVESLGPALAFDESYKVFWAYIPHFIHVPFYVYAYAFGDCLVNSLYAVYEDASDGFAEKYLDLLRAGGSKRHRELLAPFGLDASDPAFWSQGLKLVSRFIDELETLD